LDRVVKFRDNPFGISKSKKSDYSMDAWIAAEDFVKRRLKAPSTAKFEKGAHKKVKQLSNGNWHLSSYVDAQNSFGAILRTYYAIEMKRHSDKWELVTLKLNKP